MAEVLRDICQLASLHLVEIPIDEAILIGRRDFLLDALGGELHREVGGVLENFLLGEPHLQIDFAARLLEQALAIGGGGGGNALLFGLDFFGAARAQRVQLTGQRLQLLLDVGELRGGGRPSAPRLRRDPCGWWRCGRRGSR